MARMVGLQDVSEEMRKRVAHFTRNGDEVLVLPTAYVSKESGLPKNVCTKLAGAQAGMCPELFAEGLFSGVSMLTLPEEDAMRLLQGNRQALLAKLSAAIPSEMHDTELTVGPSLDGDARDRDLSDWQCGFDSAHCCVGLYSSVESASPIKGKLVSGFDRAHTRYHMVCRAGAGLAASQFLTRLTSELNKGTTLMSCLSEEGEPGAACMRRLSKAAERNRARILLIAADALGVSHVVQSISDTASAVGSQGRGAQVGTTCSFNTIRSMDRRDEKAVLYASGCLDSNYAIGGLLASSSTSDGFVYLYDPDMARIPQGKKKQRVVINEAYNCIPFASERLLSNKETLKNISKEYRNAKVSNKAASTAHPDHAWISTHFSWKNAELQECSAHFNLQEYIPLSLWGTHSVEKFMHFGRELALDNMRRVQVRPELVNVAGIPPSKLRALSRHVSQPEGAEIGPSNCSTPNSSMPPTPGLNDRAIDSRRNLASPCVSTVGQRRPGAGPLPIGAVRDAMLKAKQAVEKRSATSFIIREESRGEQ